MASTKFTLKKSERLTGKIKIDNLYKEGKSFVTFPFFVVCHPDSRLEQHKILIAVSKRRLKNATDRNTVKRRIREAYRLNKSKLAIPSSQIAFNFVATSVLDYHHIEQKLLAAFKRLNQTIEEKK